MPDDTDLHRRLRGFERHVEEYHDEEDLALDELFPPELMENRTAFDDVDAFLEAASPEVDDLDDLHEFEFDDFDPFTDEYTEFDDFVDMFTTAVDQWTPDHSDGAHR